MADLLLCGLPAQGCWRHVTLQFLIAHPPFISGFVPHRKRSEYWEAQKEELERTIRFAGIKDEGLVYECHQDAHKNLLLMKRFITGTLIESDLPVVTRSQHAYR